MRRFTRIDWTDLDAGPARLAHDLVAELEATEGPSSPLLPAELLAELDGGTRCSHWHRGGELLGFGLLRADGTFRAVLRPEHREMGLFLPMLAWAESVRRAHFPEAHLRVVAQDDDVCLPFLLLRLGFAPREDSWTRSGDDPSASVFRIYDGGQVEESDLGGGLDS